jgi:uncharacterized membrane protein
VPTDEPNPPVELEASVTESDQEERGERRIVAASFQGPLPPPAMLQAYENIVPGAAARILAMAETQASHRRELEKTEQENQHFRFQIISTDFRIKQFSATLTVLLALCGGLLIALQGQDLMSYSVFIGELVALASAFIYNEKQKAASEAEEKDKPTQD